MSEIAKIKPFTRVVPMIYAYNAPGVTYLDGWTKIGYTEKQTVAQRIRQQTHTAGIRPNLLWQDNAMFKDNSGEYFNDNAFHDFLQNVYNVERNCFDGSTEWFRLNGPVSLMYFNEFCMRTNQIPAEQYIYELRKEQQMAVDMTKTYFENTQDDNLEFLWNAKPRFGKTLTAYDLIQRMGLSKVLVVTNRPSVANAWADDFYKFVGWRGKYSFVSDNDAVKGKPGVISREEYLSNKNNPRKVIAFESLQGLKGSIHFGGQRDITDKRKWLADLQFDLLIVDESHEGVDTIKTERAFQKIKRSKTLYLSGTPFKALASEQFSKEQIFNWSYADEQSYKEKWSSNDYNPYERLPRLELFTYQLSEMIQEKAAKGIQISDEDTVDYFFDLNEFFATNESQKFIHEAEVKKFLHALSTQEKYPFSTPELRQELCHTMWYLERVASAKALKKLLKDDEVFGDYEVVLAVGDGRDDDEQVTKAYDRVKKAIAENDKTITLTVGQLTVGVTIPEWSGVLMLCNMKSPAAYMQAAFRAQNPCVLTMDNKRLRKETAYVFDFDPARTLIIFDEFANNLSGKTASGRGTTDERRENIKNLLNFLPVLGEDENGKMVKLDAAAVLSIPRRLKSQEVVRRGFMCNFLFQNISNIFGAPAVVREIVEKLTPAQEEIRKPKQNSLAGMNTIELDENGGVLIDNEIVIGKTQGLFGAKIYDNISQNVQEQVEKLSDNNSVNAVQASINNIAETVKSDIKEKILAPVIADYDLKRGFANRLINQTEREIDNNLQKIHSDYQQQNRIAQAELERKRQAAETEHEVQKAEAEYNINMEAALADLVQNVKDSVQKTIADKPQEIIEQVERHKAEQEKRSVEDEMRAHLRGFSRTIPSFIMAYGDEKLTLANFDKYVEPDAFREVTGISLEDFRFLRDGGEYLNPDTGEIEYFAGHLFDEVVFDDALEEFLHKKQQLANYFDETQTEDIFDYIPPQKTNQIFTPRWVVSMMVDQLADNNPGCFDSPDKTFADLYMKSGLYITEIVKRLYRSEGLKAAFPDDRERIEHILQKQVYGLAPTRIIYLIATNYILGFDEELKNATHNFVQADAAEAAKQGRLSELVEKCFVIR